MTQILVHVMYIRKKQCGVRTSWQEVAPTRLTIRAWSLRVVSMCLAIYCCSTLRIGEVIVSAVIAVVEWF
jgi:hypothetical protein